MSGDRVYETAGGWHCIVNGRDFGAWRSRADAVLGKEVEQRRAATWSDKITRWRTIDDDARGGEYVLIVCGEDVYVARYDRINELWYFPVDGCAVDPSHWMPIPPLPGKNGR